MTLWWGLFDQELYVEHGNSGSDRSGRSTAPIPLHRYRSFRKYAGDERLDRIEALAGKAGPAARGAGRAGAGADRWRRHAPASCRSPIPTPSTNCAFPAFSAAKLAIADYLGRPLAKLTDEDRAYIDALLRETLDRRTIITCVRGYFRDRRRTTARRGWRPCALK